MLKECQQTHKIKQSKQNTEEQRQSLISQHNQLPSSKKEKLQSQSIRITRKQSFIKRRSLQRKGFQIRTIQQNRKEQEKRLIKQEVRNINCQHLLDHIQTDKNNIKIQQVTKNKKIGNTIDLSIISQSKNESKIQTPHQNNIMKRQNQQQSQNTRNSFQKWVNSRSAPKLQQSFSQNSICNHSLNPGLISFQQDNYTNLFNGNSPNFKDCFPKRLYTISSSISKPNQLSSQLNRKTSCDKIKAKNQIAKKITIIQTLFASKGVKLCQNIQRDKKQDNHSKLLLRNRPV